MNDHSFLEILKKHFIEDSVHIQDVEISEMRSNFAAERLIKIRVYYKIQTLTTKSLRSALQGMKE